ncbi:MAG: carbohydrate kinase [Prevotella sp.]|nr:carbohydrate kinase [Prevotella sp.]
MRKVFGIGETVLDIIFKDDQPIGAVPGGSVFNSIISLGRCGVNASFISETGNDRVGRRITSFLEANGVDASSVYVYPDSKSPISLAFLNERNDAEYIFYKDHPRDRIEFVTPEVSEGDIVLFGSYYAVNPVIRPQVHGFLEHARSRGAILYYDVNFRASHKNEVVKLTPNILENLEMADVVRGSTEDFDVMFHKTDPDTIYRSQIAFYTRKFILTQGAQPVELRAEGGFKKQYPVPPLPSAEGPGERPVSTIGAGDNFNAGFVYGMLRHNINREDMERGLTEQQWDGLIASAQQFSTNVCQSLDNYVSMQFAAERKLELTKNFSIKS